MRIIVSIGTEFGQKLKRVSGKITYAYLVSRG